MLLYAKRTQFALLPYHTTIYANFPPNITKKRIIKYAVCVTLILSAQKLPGDAVGQVAAGDNIILA